MELESRHGIFGKFKFNREEQEALEHIQETFKDARKGSKKDLTLWAKDLYNHIGEAVKVLLPNEKIVVASWQGSLRVSEPASKHTRYQNIPNGRQLDFEVNSYFTGDLATKSNIKLIKSKDGFDNGNYITLNFREKSNRIKDDIVNALAKASDPILYGIREGSTSNGNVVRGISDIHRVDELTTLYKRADEILKNSDLNDNLKQLYKDAHGHLNLAICENSQQMYQRKMFELLTENSK